MTNEKLLEQKIKESGKKVTYLAEKVGLSYAGFRNCVTNKAEFKASHIHILCKELDIKPMEMLTIFFAKSGA
jgi:DNA-binding Xre family transcriptional regulator